MTITSSKQCAALEDAQHQNPHQGESSLASAGESLQLPSLTAVAQEGPDFFNWLLDYEIRGANRHRRFTTVLLVSALSGPADLTSLLRDIFRRSDELIRCDPAAIAILMRETDAHDALKAVDRFNDFYRNQVDMRIALASFPTDGRAASDLFSALRRRLQSALGGPWGAVVHEGYRHGWITSGLGYFSRRDGCRGRNSLPPGAG